MIENNDRENQQKAACRLKGTFIGNKQGLWKKATDYKQYKIEEGLPEVLQVAG
jgi:hypothetical protein